MVHATTHSWSMLLLIIFLLTQTRCSCVNIRIGDNICCFAEVLHVLSIIGIWIFFTQNVPLWSPSYFIATTIKLDKKPMDTYIHGYTASYASGELIFTSSFSSFASTVSIKYTETSIIGKTITSLSFFLW